jgi:hypothetical protein
MAFVARGYDQHADEAERQANVIRGILTNEQRVPAEEGGTAAPRRRSQRGRRRS